MNNLSVDNYIENDEIDLMKIVGILGKKYRIIVLIIVLFFGLGIVFSSLQTPVYKSNSTMAVMYDGSTNESSSGRYSFSNNITDTLVLFISENVVLNEVSKDTGYSVGKIKKNLSIKSDSLILNLSYKDTNKNNAQIMLNQIMKTAIKVADSKNSQGEPNYRMLADSLRIFSDATTATPISNKKVYISVSVLLGIVASALYVFIYMITDKKFHSSKEIEELFNIPVIASVPYYDFDEKEDKK